MRRILLFIFATLGAIVLIGCSGKDVLEEVPKEEIIIGMETAYAPFNWATGKSSDYTHPIMGRAGHADGYDVWLSKKIASHLDRKLVIKSIDWKGLIPSLNSGDIDLIIAGMSETPDRLKEVMFSAPYFESNAVFVVRKDSAYAKAASLADFAGAKMAAQSGTLYVGLIDSIEGAIKATSLPTYSDLKMAVKSKKVDAFISEYPVAKGMVNSDSELMIIELPPEKGFGDAGIVTVSIALRKDDPASYDLRNDLNQLLVNIAPLMEEEMDRAIFRQPKEVNGLFAKIGYILEDFWPIFLYGIGITILLSVLGTVGGFLLAIPLSIVRTNVVDKKRDKKGLIALKKSGSWLINIYSTVIRGTPMVVQAMILYYGITASWWSPLLASIVVVVLNTTAYIIEVLQSGINGVDQGQMEAARSLGYSRSRAMLQIILPQAIKNSLPSIGNEFIVNLKDTAIFSFIGVTDLFKATNEAGAQTFMIVESFIIAAVIYLILTIVSTQVIKMLERRSKRKEVLL